MGYNIDSPLPVKGLVHYELIDDKAGKIIQQGGGWHEARAEKFYIKYLPQWMRDRLLPLGVDNAIVNTGRNKMADWFTGGSVTSPGFIGIGTGTNGVSAADTALQTAVDYDGSNEAKLASSRSIKGQFIARTVVQFTTTEANQNIRELGLFDAANSGTMWARVNVTINKSNTQRLNIYWYVIFERRSGLAIKTGSSESATGATIVDTDVTLSFSSPKTVIFIYNNSGARIYFRFNTAMESVAAPEDYDFFLNDGENIRFTDEEISVTEVHAVAGEVITLPDNQLVVKGW